MPAGIRLGEENSLPSQGVHVRGGDFLRMIRIEADISVALVVGQDDNDVGSLCSGHDTNEGKKGKGESQHSHGLQGNVSEPEKVTVERCQVGGQSSHR